MFCGRRDIWRDERTPIDADAGEMRTPNYKAPAEIDGILFMSWHAPYWESLNQLRNRGGDLSQMVTPRWAWFRVPSRDAIPLAVVLAPSRCRSLFMALSMRAARSPLPRRRRRLSSPSP